MSTRYGKNGEVAAKEMMGNCITQMSAEEILRRATPAEECPPEKMELIKLDHMNRLRGMIRIWAQDTCVGFPIPNDFVILDPARKQVEIPRKDHIEVKTVPKNYKNGFDRIISHEEVIKMVASEIKRPFAYDFTGYVSYVHGVNHFV